MKKVLAVLASLVMATTAMPASAAQYLGIYTTTGAPTGPGTPTSITGRLAITTSDVLNSVGGYDVLSIAGLINGVSITSLTNNPNQPNQSTSPSGLFFYDNVLFQTPGAAFLTLNGLLFNTANGVEWNLWANSPAQYELVSGANGGYGAGSTGTFAVTAVPEPAIWAMMIMGFGLMGFVMRRRDQSVQGRIRFV